MIECTIHEQKLQSSLQNPGLHSSLLCCLALPVKVLISSAKKGKNVIVLTGYFLVIHVKTIFKYFFLFIKCLCMFPYEWVWPRASYWMYITDVIWGVSIRIRSVLYLYDSEWEIIIRTDLYQVSLTLDSLLFQTGQSLFVWTRQDNLSAI